ncbi:5'-3' exonuclease [Oceanobacillus neutriphilus]|uniref:5'-3' exonuclease n=1 Tax=Oceanobacillus neutriphilus TaxID=531815 RepID=A0ABQ2P1P6_9BACI|nr:5'-3' exonuclease H3TH domain-containing protein [Oceanobacillus neutriphilus]GGP15981.1 5'-3' exonuclease [Oceanobacillus neutriphilus]
MTANKVLLVDGMALLFRGFFATSFRGNFMYNSKGVPTNGVYQFLRYLTDAIQTFEPSHVVCCWDMGSKTFRTEMYDGYKANRDAPPVELIPQFDLVKEIVQSFDIPNVGLQNFEADDCMGTLANVYNPENEVFILSGDQDLLQLVKENIRVIIMRKGQGNYEVFDKDNFYEKKALSPAQIIDLKGLMGDSSDNYPGVKGIGEKTALKLLQEFETIDGLVENIEMLPKGVQNKLQADMDMLYLSRQLAEIKCDVPISCDLEGSKWDFKEDKVVTELDKLEWKHLDRLLAPLKNKPSVSF